jgi:acyl-CoA thioesterase FadM
VRFADTDRLGHITNSVFAECCQNARMEFLCDPHRVPVPLNTQFVIASHATIVTAAPRHGRGSARYRSA